MLLLSVRINVLHKFQHDLKQNEELDLVMRGTWHDYNVEVKRCIVCKCWYIHMHSSKHFMDRKLLETYKNLCTKQNIICVRHNKHMRNYIDYRIRQHDIYSILLLLLQWGLQQHVLQPWSQSTVSDRCTSIFQGFTFLQLFKHVCAMGPKWTWFEHSLVKVWIFLIFGKSV